MTPARSEGQTLSGLTTNVFVDLAALPFLAQGRAGELRSSATSYLASLGAVYGVNALAWEASVGTIATAVGISWVTRYAAELEDHASRR